MALKREEHVLAVVECPDGRIWDRHGLQLGTGDIVAEVVKLQVYY
jgi:hypothetical protein